MAEIGPPEKITPKLLNDYLEVLSKAVFQSGISWKVVESKWPGTREAFKNFDIHQVANFNENDLDQLSKDSRVIRNYRKLAAIVSNARKMIDLDKEYGSFQNYLRSHADFDAVLQAMRKDFKFMGPTGVYFFLYVVGEQVPPHHEFEARYRK
ncbi:MAG TPA: DNA-3-methyladenine glycosylase I [Anaerolineales bacterium]|nr:DNA-3-methyladenine glycosylase I [Anaerolineales bacterium]